MTPTGASECPYQISGPIVVSSSLFPASISPLCLCLSFLSHIPSSPSVLTPMNSPVHRVVTPSSEEDKQTPTREGGHSMRSAHISITDPKLRENVPFVTSTYQGCSSECSIGVWRAGSIVQEVALTRTLDSTSFHPGYTAGPAKGLSSTSPLLR